jgi:hypothetical protein
MVFGLPRRFPPGGALAPVLRWYCVRNGPFHESSCYGTCRVMCPSSWSHAEICAVVLFPEIGCYPQHVRAALLETPRSRSWPGTCGGSFAASELSRVEARSPILFPREWVACGGAVRLKNLSILACPESGREIGFPDGSNWHQWLAENVPLLDGKFSSAPQWRRTSWVF